MEQITIVIPNYNGIKYLNDCLESLYKQSTDRELFKVLVVDNGSTDGSVEKAKESFPETEWICLEENTGFSYAVNVGIKQADTPFVLLLNNDTKVLDGFVSALYEAIMEQENIFSVSAQMLMWDKEELLDDAGDRYCVMGWGFARGKGKPAEQYDKSCEVFSACAGAAIYRKKIFEEIGYFDELHFAYMEDMDVGYRAKIYGYHNMYEPSAKVLHYGSASSGSRYNEFKTKLAAANNVFVIWKNMPLLQWIWNLPFITIGFFIKFLFFCKKRMGMIYMKGLLTGLKRPFTKAGRAHKVHFHFKNLGNYFRIQLQLYANLVRIIMKS